MSQATTDNIEKMDDKTGQSVLDHIDEDIPSREKEHMELEANFQTLENLGLEQQTKRHIRAIDIICIGWNICNSWIGLGATLALSISLSGTVTLIYGILVIFVMLGASVLTMAELASVYPTAGGQYHWTSILTPKRFSRVVSYVCGIINVFAWTAISAGVAIIVPQFVLSFVLFYQSSYVAQPWNYFLIYQIVNILAVLHNTFTLRKTMWVNDVSFALTLTGFFVIVITCVSRATTRQTNEFVWTYFTNASGWTSGGVVFMTGLVNPNYMYAGIDGAIHLAEECANAAITVPRALVSTWIIGFITSFTFAIAMTYSISDFDAVISSVTGVPIYEIWNQAARSETAATVFMAIFLTAAVVSLIACEQTASRLTWSFARDNALIGSKFIGRMHPKLEVPVWALVVNGSVILIIGCIYLASSTAFNAFIGTGLILQQVTFAIPAAMLLLRRRTSDMLPPNRPFKLWGPIGWIANCLTVAFAIIVVVFYDFPVIMPVQASNMNYTSAVIGCMSIFAALNWFFWARNNYQGPRLHGL